MYSEGVIRYVFLNIRLKWEDSLYKKAQTKIIESFDKGIDIAYNKYATTLFFIMGDNTKLYKSVT